MRSFRSKTPVRTCDRTYVNYRSYKKYLIVDFYRRCAYCDGSDTWYGGHRHFHIDHFAPKDKFPELASNYDNLIYACPSCNNAKSNKWPSANANENIVNNEGFLNPVNNDLNEYFERDEFGNILGKTEVAKHMAISLNLNLERHSIMWMLTRLENLISEYEGFLASSEIESHVKVITQSIHYKLLRVFFEYQQKLKILNM